MALFDFLKKDDGNFFQWFEDAANNALQAAIELRDLCNDYHDPAVTAKRLHDLEHRGDEIGHRIYAQLNKTFLTPLDREDIIQLYSAIDEVTDLVHSTADMMVVYKIVFVPPLAKELAACIVGCAEEVVKALPYLRKRNDLAKMLPSIIQINSLENKADDLLRDGLGDLFSHPEDVIRIIKWRDIYEEMEAATDKAEDIADVLRGLSIKHA
jgi:predicted phosphate transport protein (TIGR00153 family)